MHWIEKGRQESPPNDHVSEENLPPPPDGGLHAWTQALCAHFVFFNSWGISNSFSVFEQLYTHTLPRSTSAISWIGSVQISLLFLTGAFVGRATDSGYFRPIYSLGVFLQLVGIFLLSLCKTYWQVFLAQAIRMGLGSEFTFSPGIAIMSSYFVKRRASTVGLAAAGAATGGLIYPVLINQLLYSQHIGFGWTLRAAGLLMLVTQIVALILFKPRLPPRRTGPIIEWSAFSEPPFLFFTISMFLNFWGLYFAFFYLGTFARDRLGVPDTDTHPGPHLHPKRRRYHRPHRPKHNRRPLDRQTQHLNPHQPLLIRRHPRLDRRNPYPRSMHSQSCMGWWAAQRSPYSRPRRRPTLDLGRFGNIAASNNIYIYIYRVGIRRNK